MTTYRVSVTRSFEVSCIVDERLRKRFLEYAEINDPKALKEFKALGDEEKEAEYIALFAADNWETGDYAYSSSGTKPTVNEVEQYQ